MFQSGVGRPTEHQIGAFYIMTKSKLILKLTNAQRKQHQAKKYVNFKKEADKEKLMHKDFIKLIKELIDKGYTKIPVTTVREKWVNNSFTVAQRHSVVTLMIRENNKFKFYYSDIKDEKNRSSHNPMPAFKANFKARTGKTLKQAFGATKQELKVCVPQPLYYQSPLWPKRAVITNVCKEDYSSHYPSCAIEVLPDANTAIVVNKYEKPTEEYQFAFYPETGHMAVYNEFDTHDYYKMQYIYGANEGYRRVFKTHYEQKETKTILMKASSEVLEELQDAYIIKNSSVKDSDEYLDAKLLMNKFLGQFEQNNPDYYLNSPFAHLAATIKWRANIKMFNLIRRIGDLNIIQVCVDGLLHKGEAIGNKEKTLGNLICEESGAKLVQRGINQYIVFGEKTIRCHAGLDINIESDDITSWDASEKVIFADYIKTLIEVEEI